MSAILGYSLIELPRNRHLPPPPGFSTQPSSSRASSSKNSPTTSNKLATYEALKKKRAWDLAISPAKQLPMQAFMLYMSGGGVQIFSMGIVFMLLLTPFKNIAGMNAAFAPFAPQGAPAKSFGTLTLQKLAYICCSLLTLAVGLWKCRSMGLLPTGTGDWLAFETRGQVPEVTLFS